MSINNAQGQTIIELLVALTLIILFLAGVVVVQLYALRNVQYSRNKSQATTLANQQLERLRVIRDSTGIDALGTCSSECYINSDLTPVPISPTGTFGQSLKLAIANESECPSPQITITPEPIIYKATANVHWGSEETQVTPAPEVVLTSCITDWR